jgi:hypothetical protein
MRQSLDCRVISMLWLEANIEVIVALNNVVTRLAATAYRMSLSMRTCMNPVFFRFNPKRDLIIAIAA